MNYIFSSEGEGRGVVLEAGPIFLILFNKWKCLVRFNENCTTDDEFNFFEGAGVEGELLNSNRIYYR